MRPVPTESPVMKYNEVIKSNLYIPFFYSIFLTFIFESNSTESICRSVCPGRLMNR